MALMLTRRPGAGLSPHLYSGPLRALRSPSDRSPPPPSGYVSPNATSSATQRTERGAIRG